MPAKIEKIGRSWHDVNSKARSKGGMSGHQEPESLAVYSLYDCLYSQDAQVGGRLCGVRATAAVTGSAAKK